MIVAATLSLESFLKFRFSYVPPLFAISIERDAAAASVKPHLFELVTSCFFATKAPSIFSTRYGLFFPTL